MAALSDVYTQHGTLAGRIRTSDDPLGPDEYYLHAIVILCDPNGQYLLQQRSMNMRYFPGQWDVTGGGVDAGENSLTAAIREVREELGLCLTPEQLRFAGRIPLGEKGILDMWGACAAFTASDCTLQTSEVSGVRMVPYPQFRDTIRYNKSALFMALVDDLHDRTQTQCPIDRSER